MCKILNGIVIFKICLEIILVSVKNEFVLLCMFTLTYDCKRPLNEHNTLAQHHITQVRRCDGEAKNKTYSAQWGDM